MTDARIDSLLAHFRSAFAADPGAAYREWFRAQEELRDAADAATARALADDFWAFLPGLPFSSDAAKARFFHNAGVFFGTPGPAADLNRARECFGLTLDHFAGHEETGWRARALHNFATALSNLGQAQEELEESVTLFERSLEWRTVERAIARGVTLHNMGIVLRRLAELDPGGARSNLEASAAALREAAAIRESHGLAEGHALSLFQLALTLEQLAESEGQPAAAALKAFEQAADLFDRLGKSESAAVARARANP